MNERMKGICFVKWPIVLPTTEASWKLGSKSRARTRLSFRPKAYFSAMSGGNISARSPSKSLEKMRYTVGQGSKSKRDSQRLVHQSEFFKSVKQVASNVFNQRLQAPDLGLGKEGIQSASAQTMKIVTNSGEGRVWYSKLVHEPTPFVALLGRSSIYHVVEVWICNMDFLRIDADNGAILAMKLFDLESVLAFQDDIVVELVPAFVDQHSLALLVDGHVTCQYVLFASQGPGM